MPKSCRWIVVVVALGPAACGGNAPVRATPRGSAARAIDSPRSTSSVAQATDSPPVPPSRESPAVLAPPLSTDGHAFRAEGAIGGVAVEGSCDTFGSQVLDNTKVLSTDFDQASITCRFSELDLVVVIDFFRASKLPDVAKAQGRVMVNSSGPAWCGVGADQPEVQSSLVVAAFDNRTRHIAGSFDVAWRELKTVGGCATGRVRGAFDLILDLPARRTQSS